MRDSPLSEIINSRASGDIADMSREILPNPMRENFKSKHYGELKPGTPPIMLGGSNNRQVSSGNDFINNGGFKVGRREVSGKVAEEGRVGGDGKGWGPRFRKISGLGREQ